MEKIVVGGYHGFENAGDDATLITIINSIKNIDEKIKIVVLSKNPKLTKDIYHVDAVYRFNPFNVLLEILTAKALVLGGGTLLQDITSKRSNDYYLLLIKLAKLLKKKVMLYSNGLGPFTQKTKQKTAKVLQSVDLITVRENFAKKMLEEMSVTKPIIVKTADPAFMLSTMLDENNGQKILEKENVPCDKKIIGVSVRLAKGEERYKKEIAKVCDYIIEKYDCNILFIPFQYPNDLNFSDEISNDMHNKAFLLKNKYTVKDIINVIENCHGMICMRLHSLIFSSLSNVPALGLIYDPKVEHYTEILNQEKLGNSETLEFEEAAKKVDSYFENYDSAKTELKAATDELKENAKQTERLLKNLIKNK